MLVLGEGKGQAELSGAVFAWRAAEWVGSEGVRRVRAFVTVSGHPRGKILAIS